MQGTILRGIGGFYTVMDESGALHTLRAQRKLRRERTKPKVGDRVEMLPGAEGEDGWIQAILPRRNELTRPPVANIDRIVIVASAAAPAADLPLVDSMLLAARRRGIEPLLAVSKCELNPDGAREIASRSRGTPRIANRMLRRVRDFAQVFYDGVITRQAADDALSRLEIDKLGLDAIDRRMLTAIIKHYGGGPVGLETLAATIGEEAITLEDVYEPYLMQIGFLTRTPRGRCVTPAAYDHLHLERPDGQLQF